MESIYSSLQTEVFLREEGQLLIQKLSNQIAVMICKSSIFIWYKRSKVLRNSHLNVGGVAHTTFLMTYTYNNKLWNPFTAVYKLKFLVTVLIDLQVLHL
jgi:hypothetical protein